MRLPWLSAAMLCGGMAGILPCPVWAQSADDLQALQQKLQQGEQEAKELQKKAASLSDEISQLQAAMIKSAEAVQNAEEQASELEATLQTLTAEEREKGMALSRRQAQMTTTLIALERLSAQPAQAALFADRSAIDQARAARLLGLVVPQLDNRAAKLKSELADLRGLHEQIVTRRDRLSRTLADLAGENQRLAAMVEQKSRLQKSTLAESAAAQDRLKLLADQAESLKDLLDRLERAKQEEAAKAEKARQEAAAAEAARQEAARKAARRPGKQDARNAAMAAAPDAKAADQAAADDAETQDLAAAAPGLSEAGKAANVKSAKSARPFPAAGKGLILPVRGHLAASFGAAATEFGESKGIVLATRPNAQVVAPFDGQIVFKGPFRSYGQILIIEHRGGYHTVLAGLGRVDAVVGQWLLAGEPVGVMGSSGIAATDQGVSGTSPGSSAEDHPKLYVELRHKGQPVDPAPWFGSLTRVDNSEGQ